MIEAGTGDMNTGKQEDIANVLIVDNDPELARLMLEILGISSAIRKVRLISSAGAVVILCLPAIR
ncbi:MAG: hypothetical protein ACYSUD_02355 [Planctomycetota bacterium]